MLPESMPSAAASALRAQPLRIFLVEDHGDTLGALRLLLTRRGHTVFSAQGVKEALALLPGANCGVLLSDIGLPDGTGWELLPEVTPLLPRPLYAVAMSGYGQPEDFARSRAAGFRHHLVKPVMPRVLTEILDRAGGELEKERISGLRQGADETNLPAR